ncbi:hypothetical protein Acr_05g0015750 [Actinidia rufa]|uniref:Uncharacterized protein n=1 Tax=Actinidia rufa TaxID=165716 RepID=A0A7J0EP22_9ERIC|nr:hypothetical protein Acr_05g0015750 [Actinidia rufa]
MADSPPRKRLLSQRMKAGRDERDHLSSIVKNGGIHIFYLRLCPRAENMCAGKGVQRDIRSCSKLAFEHNTRFLASRRSFSIKPRQNRLKTCPLAPPEVWRVRSTLRRSTHALHAPGGSSSNITADVSMIPATRQRIGHGVFHYVAQWDECSWVVDPVVGDVPCEDISEQSLNDEETCVEVRGTTVVEHTSKFQERAVMAVDKSDVFLVASADGKSDWIQDVLSSTRGTCTDGEQHDSVMVNDQCDVAGRASSRRVRRVGGAPESGSDAPNFRRCMWARVWRLILTQFDAGASSRREESCGVLKRQF